MSFTTHRNQNKSKRETNEVRAAEVQEIRRENQRLRRENSRLKRSLEKYSDFREEEEEMTLGEAETGLPKPSAPQCPQCGSQSLTTLNYNVKVITVCKSCFYRQAA